MDDGKITVGNVGVISSYIPVKVKKLRPDAIIPTYATDGSACFDLYTYHDDKVITPSGTVFQTGLAFEIPPGHVMKVYSRSGHGFKNGVRLSNCVGIIDSDYRGELMVKLTLDAGEPLYVKRGDRIAQAIVEPVKRVTFTEVEELSSTERGEGGFGSTGK